MKRNTRKSAFNNGTSAAVVLTSVAAMGLMGCNEKRSASAQSPQPAPLQQTAEASDDILPRVAKQIGDILGKPASSITPEKNVFKDLGADSLDAVEIVMAVEEEFQLTIDDASAEKLQTVGDIVGYIRKHKNP